MLNDFFTVSADERMGIVFLLVCILLVPVILIVIFRQRKNRIEFSHYLQQTGWKLYAVQKHLTWKGFQSSEELKKQFPLHPVQKGRSIHFLVAEKNTKTVRFVTQIELNSFETSGKFDGESEGTTEIWSMYFQVEPTSDWSPLVAKKMIKALSQPETENMPKVTVASFGKKNGIEVSAQLDSGSAWKNIHETLFSSIQHLLSEGS